MDFWNDVNTIIGKISMKLKICLTLIAFFLLSFGMQLSCSANNSTYNSNVKKMQNIQKQQAQAHAKVKHLKILENIETNKLYKNQRKLESTKNSLKESKVAYTQKQEQLSKMERDLERAKQEFINIDNELRERIRQIYKHQKTGFIQLLITSKDVNTFIDRLHFESIVVNEDYKRLQRAREKAAEIIILKERIERQKRSIAQSISTMNSQQKIIQSNIAQNQDMINKLKTNRSYYERAERDLARQSANIQTMISNMKPSAGSTVQVTTGFIKPISGPITSPFGYRIHPIFKSRIFHSGIDIGGPNGGSIKASNNGKVIYAGWYGGYGQVVILDHGIVRGQPITTLYAHMSAISVSKGQTVTKGQQIGREGSTGYSTGPHLHFEVRVNGQPRNPLNYIQ